MSESLSSSERKLLRGKAMGLPVAVHVGKAGVSPSVITATLAEFKKVELLKVRLNSSDKKQRKEWLNELINATDATICGEVGKTASIYKRKDNTEAEG